MTSSLQHGRTLTSSPLYKFENESNVIENTVIWKALKNGTIQPASRPLTPSSLHKKQPLFAQQLFRLGTETKHSNFTAAIYKQLKTQTVNRNIYQRYITCGAGGKGTAGWALGTVILPRLWQIIWPLRNKRLKCSCTATSRDENIWITASSGLQKCI